MFERQIITHDGAPCSQYETEHYFIDFCPGDSQHLVVTFEPAGPPARRPDGLRPAWGLGCLRKKGFAVLGIKPKVVDWYRQPDLHQFFRSPLFQSCIAQHAKVCFYGTSMGGYAALAFAPAAPGCTVLAFSPQSSLDRRLVPFEQRFKDGWSWDWQGDFADAAAGAQQAARAWVVFDPRIEGDRLHARRLACPSTVLLPAPCLGHVIPPLLQQLGALGPLAEAVISGEFEPARFRALIEPRKRLPHYLHNLALLRASPRLMRHCLERAQQAAPRDQSTQKLHCEVLYAEQRYPELLELALRLKGPPNLHACRAYLGLKQLQQLDDYLLACLTTSAAGDLKPARHALQLALKHQRRQAAVALRARIAQG